VETIEKKSITKGKIWEKKKRKISEKRLGGTQRGTKAKKVGQNGNPTKKRIGQFLKGNQKPNQGKVSQPPAKKKAGGKRSAKVPKSKSVRV